MSRCQSLFITGTDTGVGKTHVASLIIRELRGCGLQVGAYKPVCSGAEFDEQRQPRWSDIERLRAAVGHDIRMEDICRQRFLAPLAPPLAAQLENSAVDVTAIDVGLRSWLQHIPWLVVEGAGGWQCPLTAGESLADWASRWRFPVLVVARRGLGTINHTLLTIESIRRRGLRVAGVILNGASATDNDLSVATNACEIEARSGAPVFGEIPFGAVAELRRDGRPVTMRWNTLMKSLDASQTTSQ